MTLNLLSPDVQMFVDPADTRASVDLEVVIPAYNEEKRLPATLRALSDQLGRIAPLTTQITVVDNGSCDRTAEVVDQFLAERPRTNAIVIGCSQRGKGAAVQRGIMSSRSRYVGFFDADLATPAETLHDALVLLESGTDVVIASRRCEGAEYAVRQPVGRRVGGWAFRRAIRSLVPNVADTQCGFKFFAAHAARQIFENLSTSGFTFDVELLVRARMLGYSIHELPVVWSDDAGSSLNPVTDGPRILAEIVGLHRLQARQLVPAT